MASKTNAVRLVEQAKIPVREHFYEFDEKDLNGNHAAAAIGMPPEQVFKTLVARVNVPASTYSAFPSVANWT